jgi:hypothetical protein
MHNYNVNIVPAGTVMNTNITSAPYNVQQIYGVAIQAVFTGTPTGTFKLQASADPATSYNPAGAGQAGMAGSNNPTNWSDIEDSSYTVSAAGNYVWNVFDIMYTYIRLVYTDTSGGTSTAVLTANINAKAP